MNFLESLAAEWYSIQGYFVRSNIKANRRVNGGWDNEIDVLAFDPSSGKLVHLETSWDALTWAKREERYVSKKFTFTDDQYSKIIGKATILTETKKEFINEHLNIYKPSKLNYNKVIKLAKSNWKHEREHFQRAKEEGLTPKIAITYIIKKGTSDIGVAPHNQYDDKFKEEWPLEKIKQMILNIMNVSNPSSSDKRMIEFLRSL